jgi:rhamnulokinase
MDCRWDGAIFDLQEVHRFPIAGVQFGSDIHWDVLRLWDEVRNGLMKFRSRESGTPIGIGVDAWGVDYCLLDSRSRLVGNPYHYRDGRTRNIPESMARAVSSAELFRTTGVQTLEINTSFQLASMVLNRDQQIESAETFLMIPDLFQFLLSGEKCAEYTEASTTQLLDLRTRNWSRQVIAKLQLPLKIFPRLVMPGEILGTFQSNVLSDCGFSEEFPCISVGSHDTASAVAAIPDLDQSSTFLSSGTWSLMGVSVEQPNLSDEAFRDGFTNEGAADGGVLLLKNLTGLWLLQECVRVWEVVGLRYSWTELEAAASQATRFRCLIDPAHAAFQSRGDMIAAIQHYCAKTGQHIPQGPGELVRCIFESLSLNYREVCYQLERLTGRRLLKVRIVGGGCLNRVLCQMTADACNREVIAGPVEATALGNGMVQAVATCHIATLAEGRAAIRQSVEYRSYRPAGGDMWNEAYSHYQSLVSARRGVEQALAQA